MRAIRPALLLAILGVLASVGLERFERQLLFPAPPVPAREPALDANTLHAWLDLPDARVEAFLLLPGPARREPGPLIIHAHGNGELVDHWIPRFGELREQGIAILLVEYPGYGRGSGTPSEESIQSALVAGYDWALANTAIDGRRVIGYGHSLGGGAIGALARVRTLAAMILESTFTSIRDVAAERFGAPRFLVRNGFESIDVVRSYSGPLLVVHGESDTSIPVAYARRLAEAAPSAELELLPCGHNDCPLPSSLISSFLARHGLLRHDL